MILPFFHQTPNARISRHEISMQFHITVMNTIKCQLRGDFPPWVGVAEIGQLITRYISPSSWALPCSCVSPHDQFKVMECEQKGCTQLLGPTHENLSWWSSRLFPPLSEGSRLGNHMCKIARPQWGGARMWKSTSFPVIRHETGMDRLVMSLVSTTLSPQVLSA